MSKAHETSFSCNNRIKIIKFMFLAVCGLFIARLFSIQVLKHDEFRAQAQEQYWDLREIPSKRGNILSSDGYPLATTQVSYLMYIEPKKIGNQDFFINELAPVLSDYNKFDLPNPYEYHHQKLKEFVEKDLYWVKVIGDLTPDEKQRIEDLNLPGVGFEEVPLRYYPESTLASHVLGFVASDEKGEKKGYFGVEGSLDGDLQGKSGRIVEEQDAAGAPILVGGYTRVDPINGRDVVLTIDRGVQYIVEKKLEEGVKKYNAVSGNVIVMDPYTGNIIALANYPTYEPANFNDFGDTASHVDGKRKDIERTNLAISQTYEPGSVIKPLTVSAAIDLGKVTPETTFVDSGPVQYSDYIINNWNGAHHGVQTIIELLQKSNNIGAAWVGHQVGAKNLSEYFSNFGFGTISGVDLEGEDTGVIRPYANWTDIDLATAAFGQGISATPLQVVNAFNVFANGGLLMQPRIVAKVIDNGREIDIPAKETRRVISEETAKVMSSILTLAVDGGESKYFNLKDYLIAGKTGTAQIPVDGKYDPKKTNATFVGYLVTSRKYSMIVKLQEPETSIYAAETAVPLWMGISRELVKYYGLPVDRVLPQVAPASTSSVEATDGDNLENDVEIESTEGDGESVVITETE